MLRILLAYATEEDTMKKLYRLVAAGMAVLLLSGCALLNAEAPAAAKTSTQRVYQGNLLLGLSADGRITLPVTGLDFAVSGIIKNIYVTPGQMVQQGDLLAELDDADLQLALKTAQNNLNKAQLAYEEAVASAEYNLQSEKINLESSKRQLNSNFDDYTYALSIESAELALSRRQMDYADTVQANETAEAAARLTLSRRQAELERAENDLSVAEADAKAAGNTFDIYTYQNRVDSAQNTVTRVKKTLDDAQDTLKAAKRTYNATDSRDEEALQTAKDAVGAAENVVYNAQNSYDDALKELEVQKATMDNFTTTETTRLSDSVAAAQKSVETARQTVDDAETALSNTLNDNLQRLISARQSIDDAEGAVLKAYEDKTRGESQYRQDQQNARSSYELQELRVENLTQSESGVQNALYNIEEAKNALLTAENNLAKIRITAPISGEVLNITKKIGEKVSETEGAPSIFMGTGNTSNNFITIRDVSEIYLNARIPEGDIVGLSVGQKIRVAVDALGEENISATIYSISSIPNTDSSGIITYEVVGVLDEYNTDIRDSMSLFLTFIKREKLNVLLIPNKSVFMEDGQQYVYAQQEDGTLDKRAVSCGLSNGTQTEVLEGLVSGETVIVGRVTP
jgi:RND family efflux transporter MFP subunit